MSYVATPCSDFSAALDGPTVRRMHDEIVQKKGLSSVFQTDFARDVARPDDLVRWDSVERWETRTRSCK